MNIKGKTVCVTGKMAIKRKEAESQLEALGAIVKGSVTKDTEILFVGTDAGSKLAKAESMGIDVIDEDGLMSLLAGGGGDAKKKVIEKAKAEKAAKVARAKKLAVDSVSSVAGKVVCVTGKMAVKRKDAEAKLEALGATVKGSVTKDTEILFVGTDAGSKLAKAESMGIDIVDEAGLLKIIGE
ncbi:MAG: hypothetical protein JJ863_36645 [Deltaproteobacteria bacterium]|nr:hypothetical protein [Deltaproteobacteria bacterium]